MPVYTYKCDCGQQFERMVPRSESILDQVCECGQQAKRTVGSVSFVQRGDGWVGKNQRLRAEMARKNNRLEVRSKERSREAPGVRLVPNVGGERVESWAEAKRLAADRGHDTSAYDKLAQQERT